LLDEAITRGWNTDDPTTVQFDGWVLFDKVAARRTRTPPERFSKEVSYWSHSSRTYAL
jgi:hypothetical protein